jgi:transposase
LDTILDFNFIYHRTEGLYYKKGNPSVDPVVVVKVLLLGYLYNIPTVRETMRQIADRLSFRWFIGYDIDEPLFDHSAISKNLKRFGVNLFKELFDHILQQCVRCDLVGGKLVHVDSSTIKADASENSVKRKRHDDDNTFHPDLAPDDYWKEVAETDRKAHPNVNDRMVSSTDPDCAIISRDGNRRMMAYKDHRAVDDKRGVILVTHATSAAVTDDVQFKPVIDDLIFVQGLVPEAVAADKIYGTIENYKELANKGITANIPRMRSPRRKGQFGKEQFAYITEEDIYLCPANQVLRPQSSKRAQSRLFRASGPTCARCDLRTQCIKGKGPRTVHRHADEIYAEQALEHQYTTGFRQNMIRRMIVAEGSFAESKNLHSHRKARWRGQEKMQIQCYLIATVQNLKKLLRYAWKKTADTANYAISYLFITINYMYSRHFVSYSSYNRNIPNCNSVTF